MAKKRAKRSSGRRFQCSTCPPTRKQFYYLSQLAADADYRSPGAAIKDCLGISARTKIDRKQASDVIKCLRKKV